MSLGIVLGKTSIKVRAVVFPLTGGTDAVVASALDVSGVSINTVRAGEYDHAFGYGLIPECVVSVIYRAGKLTNMGVGPDPLVVSEPSEIDRINQLLAEEDLRLNGLPEAEGYAIRASADEKTDIFGLSIFPSFRWG